jgi:hypothetical protein
MKSWIEVLLFAFPLLAQEERPDLSVAEPERAARAEIFIVASLLYNDAQDGQDRFPLAVHELLQFAGKHTPFASRIRGEDRTLRQLSDVSLLYMSGNNGQFRIGKQERNCSGNFCRAVVCSLPKTSGPGAWDASALAKPASRARPSTGSSRR